MQVYAWFVITVAHEMWMLEDFAIYSGIFNVPETVFELVVDIGWR